MLQYAQPTHSQPLVVDRLTQNKEQKKRICTSDMLLYAQPRHSHPFLWITRTKNRSTQTKQQKQSICTSHMLLYAHSKFYTFSPRVVDQFAHRLESPRNRSPVYCARVRVYIVHVCIVHIFVCV